MSNKNLEIIKVYEDSELQALEDTAREIWNEYFTFILSDEQIEYMLDKFLSKDVLKDQLDDNYEYYFLMSNGQILGFFIIHPEEKKLFLSKIYLYDRYRNKGYSNQMFDYVEKRAQDRKLNKVYLTVNKYNKNPINIYKHKGYKVVDSVVTDIGNGFVMDDYIMEKNLD